MKQTTAIYIRDVKNIARNWVAAGLILGLVFLPSLYAWFNILASWDPYGHTSALAVAVANKDEGTILQGRPMNIGNEVISSLKQNHDIGWIFVDEQEAKEGVRLGSYYACIIIPADFSAKLATVLTNTPQKAEVVYYENEKINAIAPKITTKGASSIVEQVNENFVRVANGIIFQIFNGIGAELEKNRPTIEQVRDIIYRLNELSPTINRTVNVAIQDVEKTDGLVKEVQSTLPLVAKIAQDGEVFSNQLTPVLDASAETIKAMGPTIKQDLLFMQQAAMASQQLTSILLDKNADPNLVQDAVNHAIDLMTVAEKISGNLMPFFSKLDQLLGRNQPSWGTTRLQDLNANLTNQLTLLNTIKGAVMSGEMVANEWLANLNQLSGGASAAIEDILQKFDTVIQPDIIKGLGTVKEDVQHAHDIFASVTQMIPDVQTILDDAAKGLAVGGQKLKEIQQSLPVIEERLKKLTNQMQALENQGALDQLINLLKLNAAKESEFFAQPVVLNADQFYPIPNYGSAMSPFYTTLSLWVGGLLLVSLLTVEVHEPGIEYKSYQIYLGRSLTFITLAIMQSILVTLGDIFILGTFIANKLWFVVFGMILSAVFMLMIYTLVSIFGNVGKAMAIVLLVIQLGGSGGTFPIQLTPAFFQAVYPFLPFTYGISLLREAVGGILWEVIATALFAMGVYVVITLVMGLALKKTINKYTSPLLNKAKESKLIH